MIAFTIKKNVFQTILELTQANGKTVKGENKPMYKDCIIEVGKKELSIKTLDENEILYIGITSKITGVTEEGKIPVELEPLIEGVKRFNDKDEITISYDELITISRKKPILNIKIPTMAIDEVKSQLDGEFPFTFDSKNNYWTDGESTTLDTYAVLDVNQFTEVIKDGEQIKHRTFPFKIEKGKIMVTVEDIDSGAGVNREIEVTKLDAKKEVSSLYSYGFGNAFGNLSGEIKIWIANEEALAIAKHTDDYDLVYILATTELEDEDEEEGEEDDDENNISKDIDEIVEEGEEESEENEPEPEPEPEPKPTTKKKVIKNGKK